MVYHPLKPQCCFSFFSRYIRESESREVDYFWQQQEYFSGGVRVPGDGCSWLAIFVGNFLRILGFQLLRQVLYKIYASCFEEIR